MNNESNIDFIEHNNESNNNNDNLINSDSKTKKESMLTTVDNPFDPFTEFNDWYNYDCEKKYFTCNYVDRIANTNSSMTNEEKEKAIDEAYKEIVYYNPDLYLIVHRDMPIGDEDDYFLD